MLARFHYVRLFVCCKTDPPFVCLVSESLRTLRLRKWKQSVVVETWIN